MSTRRCATVRASRRAILGICLALAAASFGYVYVHGLHALPLERITTDVVVYVVGCLLVFGVMVLAYDEVRAWWRRG
jgi:hypothetical protein